MSEYRIDMLSVWSLYYNAPYTVGASKSYSVGIEYEKIAQKQTRDQTIMGRDLSYKNAKGIDVFLPITLTSGINSITLDCVSMRVQGKKHTVNTPLVERVGSVIEEFPVDNYIFSIKGVLIAKDGIFPDNEIMTLRNIFESTDKVTIDNALSDLFLDKTNKVVITNFDILEETTGTLKHRPFTMTLESDFIDTLIIT